MNMRGIFYWIQACRVHTLFLSVAATITGNTLVYQYDKTKFSWSIFALGLVTSMGLQVVANLANDLGDSLHGIDNASRVGPDRVVQKGFLTPKSVERAVWAVGGLTFMLGCWLCWQAFGPGDSYFWLFILLGTGAIWAAVRYTHGARPYGHKGGGDLAVFFFFGLLGTKGTYFLCVQSWAPEVLLPACGLGAYFTAVLNANNIRDITTDLIAGKRSLAARFGHKGAVIYHKCLLLGGTLCWLIYSSFYLPFGWNWLFTITYPALLWIGASVRKDSTPEALNLHIKQLVILILLHAIFFSVGSFMST